MGVGTPAAARKIIMNATEVRLAVKPAPNAASVDMNNCLRSEYELTRCVSTAGVLCIALKLFSFLGTNSSCRRGPGFVFRLPDSQTDFVLHYVPGSRKGMIDRARAVRTKGENLNSLMIPMIAAIPSATMTGV